jgi:two-component system, chemotaxis family, response regulator Rcp1
MSMPTNQGSLEILLVEDNLSDIRLTQEVLGECGLCVHLSVVRDGEEAMAHLRRTGTHAAAPRPALILLDLNLPKKGGLEVLAEVKADPSLRRIPIIVLTTSSAEQDINKSYDLHANCYITKPVQIERFISVVQSINVFWLQVVQFSNESA